MKFLNALNNKHIVGGIFYDLTKEFYCVNCDILILKYRIMELLVRIKNFFNHTLKVDTKS